MARLSKRQKKEIKNAYQFSSDERKEILSYSNNWDEKKLNTIKSKIRAHYKKEQGGLCCFCKLPFRDIAYGEHTVPKGGAQGRPDFSFEAKNLSLACYHCNTKKSTNNDMINWDRNPYPNSGIYFKIIHPHFDRFSDNIAIVDKSRYIPLTIKGYRTINRCKLYESNISEVLVKSMKYEDDPLIQGVLRFRELQGDINEIKNKIDRFFKMQF